MDSETNSFPESLLLPGEKVLWTGSPSATKYGLVSLPSHVDTAIAIILIAIGLYIVLRVGHSFLALPIVADIFSSFLIFAGLFMLSFPPAFAYFAARRTMYAVTSERVLVVDKLSNKITRQYLPGNLGDNQSVVTESNCVYFANSYDTPLFGAPSQPVGFDYIPDAQKVANLIDSTLRKDGNKA